MASRGGGEGRLAVLPLVGDPLEQEAYLMKQFGTRYAN